MRCRRNYVQSATYNARGYNPLKLAANLTTYNRSRLLAQSLPMIERECCAAGVSLLIADNGSTDPETNRLIAEASNRGIRVFSYIGATVSPHLRTTANLLQSFVSTLAQFRDVTHVVHFEDDIVLSVGALPYLIELWNRIKHDGVNLGLLSGMRPEPTRIMRSANDYVIACGARHPTVIYRRDIIDRLLTCAFVEANQELQMLGVDVFVCDRMMPIRFPGVLCAAPIKSVTYHTGLVGVHTRGEHHNYGTFAGSLDGVIME